MAEISPDNEKAVSKEEIETSTRIPIDLDELGETEGYVIDASLVGQKGFENLKLTKDGKTVLIPQPSDDPNDPLNVGEFPTDFTLCAIVDQGILTLESFPVELAEETCHLDHYFSDGFPARLWKCYWCCNLTATSYVSNAPFVLIILS